MRTALLLLAGAVGVFFLDRALRWMEDRGWIYYRKSGPGGGAIGYHMLETSAVFNPSAEVVQEIMVEERRQEDEAGDPPARSDVAGPDTGRAEEARPEESR